MTDPQLFLWVYGYFKLASYITLHKTVFAPGTGLMASGPSFEMAATQILSFIDAHCLRDKFQHTRQNKEHFVFTLYVQDTVRGVIFKSKAKCLIMKPQ